MTTTGNPSDGATLVLTLPTTDSALPDDRKANPAGPALDAYCEDAPLRLLLVDDDEDDYIITEELLRDQRTRCQLEWQTDYRAALRVMKENRHDVYLLDYRLGPHTGLELLAQARRGGCTGTVILLTGLSDGDVDQRALRAGAADYLVKGRIDSDQLARSIRYSLERDRLLHEVHERNAQLAALAREDQLTGLANRRHLHERLDEALARARRSGTRVGLMLVDLDGFKAINDSLGHDAGDRLLRAVAARLKSSVRCVDVVARLGGDEFTVLLDRMTEVADAAIVGERILANLAPPYPLDDRVVGVSASIGVAVFPDQAADPKELLRNADEAMYRAKHGGRNRLELYGRATAAAIGHAGSPR